MRWLWKRVGKPAEQRATNQPIGDAHSRDEGGVGRRDKSKLALSD
jgi:hypothetical protein